MHIDQNMFLSWFEILTKSYEKFLTGMEYFSIPKIFTIELETIQLIFQGLWFDLQSGFCIEDLDRILILVIILRFIILVYRYNVKTSIIITATGIFAGYLWYSRFLKLILMYEKGLYKIPYTNKLAIDASQIRFLVLGTLKNSDYQMRINNPAGMILYAFGNNSIYQGHRIDPISMIVASIPENSDFKHIVQNIYYLFYRKFIPAIFRVFKVFNKQLNAIIIYTVITRVNKKYCPYLIRWHWTAYFLIAGTDRVFVSLFRRTQYYLSTHIINNLQSLENRDNFISVFNYFKILNFKLVIVEYIGLFIVTFSISLTLFLLFHSLCGQYVYLPFITENVELHIGLRDKESIYSGGLTAWQNSDEKVKNKLWFGWFGSGTLKKQNSILRFKKILYNKIYIFYKQIKKRFNSRF